MNKKEIIINDMQTLKLIEKDDNLDHIDKFICRLNYFTGLRRFELSQLLNQLKNGKHSSTRYVVDAKGGKKILVFLNDKILNDIKLEELKNMTPRKLTYQYEQISLKFGEKIESHGWRRGLASDADRIGIPVQKISSILNHSNQNTTQKYISKHNTKNHIQQLQNQLMDYYDNDFKETDYKIENEFLRKRIHELEQRWEIQKTAETPEEKFLVHGRNAKGYTKPKKMDKIIEYLSGDETKFKEEDMRVFASKETFENIKQYEKQKEEE